MIATSTLSVRDFLDDNQVAPSVTHDSNRFACSQAALTMVNSSPTVLQKFLSALELCAPQNGMHSVEIFLISWEQFAQAWNAMPSGLVIMNFDNKQVSCDGKLLGRKLRQLREQQNTTCIPVVARGHDARKLPREVLKNTSVLIEEEGNISEYESVVSTYLAPFSPTPTAPQMTQ